MDLKENTMVSETGKTADGADLRPWRRPVVTRMDMKKTMYWFGSLNDGSATGSQ